MPEDDSGMWNWGVGEEKERNTVSSILLNVIIFLLNFQYVGWHIFVILVF